MPDGATCQRKDRDVDERGVEFGALGRGFDALPLWLKVIFIFGFPTFVSLFYMGQDAGIVPSTHSQTIQALVALKTAVETNATKIDTASRRVDELSRDIKLGLRIICENAATHPTTGASIQPHFRNCQNIH